MTDYYIQDRDLFVECTISGTSMTIKGLGIFYTEADCDMGQQTNATLGDTDQVYDMESYSPLASHDLDISSTSSSGWTYTFQVRDGSSWGEDLTPPLATPTNSNLEWRVHANDGENDIYSDPFIRIASGCWELPHWHRHGPRGRPWST